MNPYSGASFLQTLTLFFSRIPQLVMGHSSLASDEVQLLVLLGLAVCSSILGVVLYMKKMTMAAGALSHTILLGIVLAYLGLKQMSISYVSVHTLPTLLVGGALAALLTLFFNDILHQKLGVERGASIGLVFTTLFALSLLIVSLYLRNTHIGLESIMGNLDGVHVDDLKPVGFITLVSVVFMMCFFRSITLSAFDPLFAKIVGVRTGWLRVLLMLLLALSATLFFRAVGVVLFLAFLMIPVFIARSFTSHLKPLLVFSCSVSVASSLIGVALSRHLLSYWHLPLSTSALVVVSMLALGLISYVVDLGKTMVINRKKRYIDTKRLADTAG